MTQNTGDTKPTVVRIWLNDYLYPGYLDPVLKLAEEFSAAHPEYQVDIRGVDFRTMPEVVAEAVEEGNPPHVAEFFYTATQVARDLLGANGRPLFTSVEKAIGGRGEILGEPVVIDDIVPAARDYYTYGGELTSVPPTASTLVLYGNTTVLDKAGVSWPPRTWDDVELACKAVAELPDGPGHGITWPNHGWTFQQAVAQQGGLLTDQDNGRSGAATSVDLAGTEILAYVDWWRRLNNEGHYLYTGTPADWMGTYHAFAEQRVAFAVTSSVEAGRMVTAGIDGGFTVDVSWLPHNGGAPYAGVFCGGDSMWLADGLDEATRDGALAFMQLMLEPRHVADWHRANGRIPITNTAIALLEREGWFAENPHLRVATDQLAATNGTPAALGPLLGAFAAVQDLPAWAMHDVLVSGADPAARFAEATAAAQRLLDEYNTDCHSQIRRTPRSLGVCW
jgi:sn-glycerol 3-phosphate transport system substrate-binding protein